MLHCASEQKRHIKVKALKHIQIQSVHCQSTGYVFRLCFLHSKHFMIGDLDFLNDTLRKYINENKLIGLSGTGECLLCDHPTPPF